MGAFYRNVLYPAYHWAKNDGVNRARAETERNQWLPAAEVLALQQEKLNRLISFAREHVPYYRTLLNEAGMGAHDVLTPEDMYRVPPLTKDRIREHGKELVSENLKGNSLISNSTSGSTGEATRFYTDMRSIAYRKAAGIRSNSWTGWQLGDRFASLWGAQLDSKRAKSIRSKLNRLVSSRCFLSSFDLSEARMAEYVETLRRFKPVLFLGYPGPLEQFANHCREHGHRFPSLKAIVCSAETLWQHQRETIEEAFGVKVFDRYGSREVGQMACECETHDGLHVSADRLLIEIINDDGSRCAPGETGKLLVTDLDNYGMPLIRYDIGDRGVAAENSGCSCGRGLPKIAKIEGRTMDVVVTRDGRRLGGTFWTLLLRSRPGIRQFQVVQDAIDGIRIDYIPDESHDRSAFDYFKEKIREYCGPDFDVVFVKKEKIDLAISGKRRIVMSNLAQHIEATE